MWYDDVELDGIDDAVIAAAVATIDELFVFWITDALDATVDEAYDCDIGLANCDLMIDDRWDSKQNKTKHKKKLDWKSYICTFREQGGKFIWTHLIFGCITGCHMWWVIASIQ